MPGRHDRAKQRLLPEDHPVSGPRHLRPPPAGSSRPPGQAPAGRGVPAPARRRGGRRRSRGGTAGTRPPSEPLRVVDLGCGNAYLTFAAHRSSTASAVSRCALTGVDVQGPSRAPQHGARRAARRRRVRFVPGDDRTTRSLDPPPDVVLALHACDTATDDALARAVGWQAPLVLAAPCCHHDMPRQLAQRPPPAPYACSPGTASCASGSPTPSPTRSGPRCCALHGYRVDVVEFVESAHTPRNTLAARGRTGVAGEPDAEYDELVSTWRPRPAAGGAAGRPWRLSPARATLPALTLSAAPPTGRNRWSGGRPADHGGQRPGRRRELLTTQRLRLGRRGVRGRRGHRARPSASTALVGRAGRRRGSGAAAGSPGRSGSPTSATTTARGRCVSGVPRPRVSSVRAGTTYRLGYPDGAARRRGAAGASRTGRLYVATKALARWRGSTPPPGCSRSAQRADPGGAGRAAGHRRRVPAGRPACRPARVRFREPAQLARPRPGGLVPAARAGTG